MEANQAKFDGWAIVELFGHQKEAGYVTTEYYGSAAMFRIDVPELPEREWVLERPQRGDDYALLPIGTKVRREAVPARTRLVGPGAVYGMTPCTDEVVRRAIESGIQRPLIVLEMPKDKQLAIAAAEPIDPEDRQTNEYDEEEEDHTADKDFEDEELPL